MWGYKLVLLSLLRLRLLRLQLQFLEPLKDAVWELQELQIPAECKGTGRLR